MSRSPHQAVLANRRPAKQWITWWLAAFLLVVAAQAWAQTAPDPGGQTAAPSGFQTSALLVKLVAGLSPADQAAVIARNGGTIDYACTHCRIA